MLQKYTVSKYCSFCESDDLEVIIDFGKVALAGGFIKPKDFETEELYPLSLYFCKRCCACQILEKVDGRVLFNDYFYFSSTIKTLRDHFSEFAEETFSRFLGRDNAIVVEFGCNDGVLLEPFASKGIKTVIGVDPAKNVVNTISNSKIHIINDFFCLDVSNRIIKDFGNADLIAANNVFAHIPDINGTTEAVKKLLAPNGVFVFEVHYLGNMISELQYDMIYHEHIYYHSLTSLQNHFQRFKMTVFDVKPVPTHAGSMRFYVALDGSKHANSIKSGVIKLQETEKSLGYDNISTFGCFKTSVNQRKIELLELLKSIKKSGKTIAGYGASGRASTMMQFCEIDQNYLDYLVDDSPQKLGYYTPKSHLEIKGRGVLTGDNPPDFVLLFAWSFFDEIVKKNQDFISKGGRFIRPLPTVCFYPE